MFRYLVFLSCALCVLAARHRVPRKYGIPDPSDKALMGRYIIHNVDWISIATISTLDNVKNYPFANLKSVADGPADNGTGVPYLLMTDMDLSGHDVQSNNRVTLLASLAEIPYCKSVDYDPQDPRCGRIIITGKLLQIPSGTDEYEFAFNSLVSKHPIMALWVQVHKFYVAKIAIEQVCVLDYFGGAAFIPVDEYLKAQTPSFKRKPELPTKMDITVHMI